MSDPRNVRLTPNFTLAEFVRPEDPLPPPWILDNLYRLANRLQVVRDLLDKPLVITSGYRTEAHNRAIGGAKKSLHLSGMAADVVVPGIPAKEVQKFLRNWSGGLGLYGTFTHLDIRPYRARWR